jgi:hypothetical protein
MRAWWVRDHQIPPIAENVQNVALDMLSGRLARQQVARPSIVPTTGEGVADAT